MSIHNTEKGYYIAAQKWGDKVTIIAIDKDRVEALSKCLLRVCQAFNKVWTRL